MPIHRYYLLTITQALTDDTVDENGNITELGTRSMTRDALLTLGNLRSDAHLQTHMRFSLDGQKVIVECETNGNVTKDQFVSKLSELLPWTETQINNNLEITKFEGTYEESRELIKQYLINNINEWELIDG